MRKIILAIASIALAVSCNNTTVSEVEEGVKINISLASERPSIRGAFDNTASAEDWEKSITSLTIYVFNSSDNIVLQRSLSAKEIIAGSASFQLPHSLAGTTCKFYAVANADYGAAATSAVLDQKLETAVLEDYNGDYSVVSTQSKRDKGFVMNGKTTKSVNSGSATEVSITLKRVVAKVVVRIEMSNDFTSIYNGGKVLITGAKISNAASKSYSFSTDGNYASYSSSFSYTQVPANTDNRNFNNLFYVYESAGSAQEDGKVLLTLSGYFDADGKDSTTDDRIEVSYKIVLSGTGNGEIKRNGYYIVEGTIGGLSGDSVAINFTVADWETPVSQSVDLGL